jgi:hypothetical protein
VLAHTSAAIYVLIRVIGVIVLWLLRVLPIIILQLTWIGITSTVFIPAVPITPITLSTTLG